MSTNNIELPFKDYNSLVDFIDCPKDLARTIKEYGCNKFYKTFYIDKETKEIVPKSYPGNLREINAPNKFLKNIQKKLLGVFNVFKTHPANAGFIEGKSLIDAVETVVDGETLVHVDIEKFFDNNTALHVKWKLKEKIKDNYGVELDNETLNMLVTLLCKDNKLPQGSPASPFLVVALNYEMDEKVQAIAEKYNLKYARYADDLAFSGTIEFNDTQKFIKELREAIHPFIINDKKLGIMKHSAKPVFYGVKIISKSDTGFKNKNVLSIFEKVITTAFNIEDLTQFKVVFKKTKDCKGFASIELQHPEFKNVTVDDWHTKYIDELTAAICEEFKDTTEDFYIKPHWYYIQSTKHLLGLNIQDGKYNYPRKHYESLRLISMLVGRQKAFEKIKNELFENINSMTTTFDHGVYSRNVPLELPNEAALLKSFAMSGKHSLDDGFRNLLLSPFDLNKFNGILAHIQNVDNAKFIKLKNICEKAEKKCLEQYKNFFDIFSY